MSTSGCCTEALYKQLRHKHEIPYIVDYCLVIVLAPVLCTVFVSLMYTVDYEKLPEQLSEYQKQYTLSRRNTLKGAAPQDLGLNLPQILRLLDSDLEEHEV